MSKKEKTRYNLDPIDKEGALINIIHGKRSNGKSYQVKHKKAVLKYFNGENPRYTTTYKNREKVLESVLETGTRFILLRRFKDEISTANVEQYFDDVDIMKITNNKCNCIVAYKGRIYLANYDSETTKTIKYDHIGYYRALSQEQVYAGNSMLDVTDIIYEEFVSRTAYLGNSEPSKLMNFYSTIDRGRGVVKLWLVGNSITRVCPYFYEWGLSDLMRTMNKGDIKTKWLSTGDFDDDGNEIFVKLAIERCSNDGGTNYIIGTHADMMNKGEWQSDPQPHLPKSYKCYKMLYRIIFQYQTFKFIGEYLMDKENKDTCWFIYPYDKEIGDNIIVFSDVIKTSPYWQKDIYNPLIRNDKIKDLLKTFKESNIFYASDICGTDFKQVIDFEIRK